MSTPRDPAMPLLGIYRKGIIIHFYKRCYAPGCLLQLTTVEHILEATVDPEKKDTHKEGLLVANWAQI